METVQIVLLAITVFWFLFLVYLVNWFKKLLHNNVKEKTLFCCEVKKNTAIGIFISCLIVFVVLIVVMSMAFTGAYTSTSSDAGTNTEPSTGNSLFYLHPTQNTVLCPNAAFNSFGQVNGYTYTKRTFENLKELIKTDYFTPDRISDIELTCTSGITSFLYLFLNSNISENNIKINLSTWDTSNVITMEGTFLNARFFNSDISNWNVSQVVNMNFTFADAAMFNQPLEKWDTSNVVYMNEMFDSAYVFNMPINKWDVSNVKILDNIFVNAFAFNQPLNEWNTENLISMDNIFYNNAALSVLNLNSVCNWNRNKCFQCMNPCFTIATNGYTIICPFAPVGSSGYVDKTDNGAVLRGYYTKVDNTGLFSIMNLNEFNFVCTTGVTNMDSLFPFFTNKSQTLISSLNIDTWDTSSVTNMNRLFYGTNFNGPINNWDVSKVQYFESTFGSSQFNQPLNSWDTSSMIDGGEMFRNNIYFNQDISNFNTNNIKYWYYMFNGAKAFNQDLRSWSNKNSNNSLCNFSTFTWASCNDMFGDCEGSNNPYVISNYNTLACSTKSWTYTPLCKFNYSTCPTASL